MTPNTHKTIISLFLFIKGYKIIQFTPKSDNLPPYFILKKKNALIFAPIIYGKTFQSALDAQSFTTPYTGIDILRQIIKKHPLYAQLSPRIDTILYTPNSWRFIHLKGVCKIL